MFEDGDGFADYKCPNPARRVPLHVPPVRIVHLRGDAGARIRTRQPLDDVQPHVECGRDAARGDDAVFINDAFLYHGRAIRLELLVGARCVVARRPLKTCGPENPARRCTPIF